MEPIILISVFLGVVMVLLGLVGWIMDVDRRYISKTYDPGLKWVKIDGPQKLARADHDVYDWKEECPNDFR